MKAILGIVSTFIAIFAIAGYLFVSSEQPYAFYETYNLNLHEGNWVPDIFPDDIKEIHHAYNIDTNEIWVRFEIGSKEFDLNSFQVLTYQEILKLKIRTPLFSSWWFQGIIEQQPSNDAAINATIYKGTCGKNMFSFIAVPKVGSTYYWWCQSA